MSAYQLVLHPAEADAAPAPDSVTDSLRIMGLLDTAFPLGRRIHFAAGPRFLELVTFLGCSPAIELEPPPDPAEREAAALAGRFCHVHVTPASDNPVARPRFQGRGTATARLFIEIWGVYPSEAVPAPSLLAGLADTTGVLWKYFYSSTPE